MKVDTYNIGNINIDSFVYEPKFNEYRVLVLDENGILETDEFIEEDYSRVVIFL